MMNHTTQSTPSDSSGASPDSYQAQSAGSYQPKPYRQHSGHHPQFIPPVNMVNGHQYPTGIAAGASQFYPAMVPGTPGYAPVYAPGIHGDHTPCYLVASPGGWAMQTPVSYYSQLPLSASPPPQMPIPYSYPISQRSEHDFYATSPPIAGPVAHMAHYMPPPLDHHRRTSWSSSGGESPITPFPIMADPNPIILGDPQVITPTHSVGRSIEDMVKDGPPIPPPVHSSSQSGRQFNNSMLDNPTNTTNVYVRGLPPNTNDDKLLEITARFGRVTSHKAIMDTEHGTCKGYGFARYETVEEAANCIQGLIARNYEAGFARESFNSRLKTLADPNSTNIYVSNLPRDMNEKDMQDIFAEYVVVSNRILRDANGVSRGVGFARFESREICDEIIKRFHGMPVGADNLPLQVRYADTSAQKRLKATTTRKRQFRTNEYNNLVNGGYWSMAPQAGYRGRAQVWMRHNSVGPHGSHEPGAPPFHHFGKHRNWERSHDWQSHTSDENHPEWPGAPRAGWRHASNGSHEARVKQLEPVQETGSTGNHSGRLLNGLLASTSRASVGSFSDPGDSYGGREYTDGVKG